MSRVSASFRKLFLRGILWDAAEGGLALREALKIAARSKLNETSSGKVLTGTSRSGHSVDFTLPASGRGLTPLDIAETVSGFLDCYDTATAALGYTEEQKDDPANNDAIFARMLSGCAAFTPVRRFGTDHSQMRQEPAYA